MREREHNGIFLSGTSHGSGISLRADRCQAPLRTRKKPKHAGNQGRAWPAAGGLCAGQRNGVRVLSARLFRPQPPQWRLNPMAKRAPLAKITGSETIHLAAARGAPNKNREKRPFVRPKTKAQHNTGNHVRSIAQPCRRIA
jgi:hypothetical protein